MLVRDYKRPGLTGDCSIPNSYDKSSIDNVNTYIYTDVYIEAEIGSLIATIDILNYYNKTDIDDLARPWTGELAS